MSEFERADERRVAIPPVPAHDAPDAPQEAPSDPLDERSIMLSFELARVVNQHSTEYIRMADSKAAILITLLSANLLVLVQRGGESIAQGHAQWQIYLVLAACGVAITSLSVAVNIIRPRMIHNAKPGHVFWEDISAQDKDGYAESFQHLTPRTIFRELSHHNHNLASAAIRKYRWLRAGFFCALISVVFSAGVILLTSST